MAENDVKPLVSSIEQHIRKIHDTLAELGIKLSDIGASEEFKDIKEHFVDIDWHLHDLMSHLSSSKDRTREVLTTENTIHIWEDFKHLHQDMEHAASHFTGLAKSPIIDEIESSVVSLEKELHEAIQDFSQAVKLVLDIIREGGKTIAQLENCYLQSRALRHGVTLNLKSKKQFVL